MPVPRIYTGQQLNEGAQITLEEGPSRHLAGALRLQPGQPLCLFSGRGGEYAATIHSLARKSVSVVVGAFSDRCVETPLRIHLGIAASRGERMDWVVQKATELGVDQLTPLFSERTEVRLNEQRAAKKVQHWQQIAISSCEQCGRNQLPQIHAMAHLSNWCAAVPGDQKLVLHHRADSPGEERPGKSHAVPTTLALLIGPEGGLSSTELATADQHDFVALALGPRVLRTETAPLAAIAILQSRWGDMRLY